MSALAERWMRAVPSLRESALRAAYMGAEIDQRAPLDVARALDVVCSRAEQADPRARDVLGAMIPVVAEPARKRTLDALRRIAAQESLLALARLLRKKKRGATIEPVPVEERGPVRAESGRALTLGERRSLARRPTRAALDKLLRDPHPMVIRRVLDHPRLTEDDVVRMAAQRPAYPDVIAEIVRHPSWPQRARVRLALVQNPATPPELAVPLVRLLIRPELRAVLRAEDVPNVVRAAASELLARRPPVPERRGEPQ